MHMWEEVTWSQGKDLLQGLGVTEPHCHTGLGIVVTSDTWESLSRAWLFVTQRAESMEFSRIIEWVAFPFSRDLPNPGIEPRSPTLQAVSLPAEPQGKPRNNGVGRLSLLEGIFPTQQWNWDLLHCRQFLYQLSYQRSPGNSGSFHQSEKSQGLWRTKDTGGAASVRRNQPWIHLCSSPSANLKNKNKMETISK